MLALPLVLLYLYMSMVLRPCFCLQCTPKSQISWTSIDFCSPPGGCSLLSAVAGSLSTVFLWPCRHPLQLHLGNQRFYQSSLCCYLLENTVSAKVHVFLREQQIPNSIFWPMYILLISSKWFFFQWRHSISQTQCLVIYSISCTSTIFSWIHISEEAV